VKKISNFTRNNQSINRLDGRWTTICRPAVSSGTTGC